MIQFIVPCVLKVKPNIFHSHVGTSKSCYVSFLLAIISGLGISARYIGQLPEFARTEMSTPGPSLEEKCLRVVIALGYGPLNTYEIKLESIGLAITPILYQSKIARVYFR